MLKLKIAQLAKVLLISLFVTGIKAHSASNNGPWTEGDLFTVPKHFPSDDFKKEGFTSLFYQGIDYNGKEARFYAYYKMPKGKPPPAGWPAVVCVPGGGMTATPGWVDGWVKNGYAAISMDLEGHLPAPVRHDQRPGHPWSGPPRKRDMGDIKEPLNDHYFYHAIPGVIRAHSLLRSFPEIDKNNIGINGISWGGIITSLVSGIDDRFKFGIVIDGCGYLHEGDSYVNKFFKGLPAALKQKKIDYYEPSSYLGNAKMPMMWVNSTIDQHFPLNVFQKSLLATQGTKTLYIKPELGHGAEPKEKYVFADSIVKGGMPLIKLGPLVQKGNIWSVKFESTKPVEKVQLCYTTDSGVRLKRKWHTIPATLSNRSASAILPENTTVFFFNITDERGMMVSSLSRDFTEDKGFRDPRLDDGKIVLNGGFEIPRSGIKPYGAGNSSLPGWKIEDGGQKPKGGGIVIVDNWQNSKPSEGKQFLQLQCQFGDSGIISQTIDTETGQNYRLQFDYSALGFGPRGLTIKYNVDGVEKVVSFQNVKGQVPWATETYQFTASSTKTDLSFKGGFFSGFWGTSIDDVRVEVVK